jgi:hypothetical protein
MNCQLAREEIVTVAYGEVGDPQARELELHMASCPECHEEQEQLLALKALAEAHPVVEPDANLIARSRMRLEEALDALPPRRWHERLGQRLRNGFANLRAAPVAACLLLASGAGAGSLGGYHMAQKHTAPGAAAQVAQAQAGQAQQASMQPQTALAPAAQAASPAEIANISSIVRKPGSGMVEVRFNRLVPQRIDGSMDDPAIRQLLLVASGNAVSARVRNDSVGLLAAECLSGQGCQQGGIREALIGALRYDPNASVRRKALQGLEPYVAQDVRVRDAVLEALMNDGDPRIRSAAINILGPVEADTSVRQVLYTVSNSDQSPQIRTVSREVLDNAPQIQ